MREHTNKFDPFSPIYKHEDSQNLQQMFYWRDGVNLLGFIHLNFLIVQNLPTSTAKTY